MQARNAAAAKVAADLKEETKENAALTNLQKEEKKVADAHLMRLREAEEDLQTREPADARERKAVAAAAVLKVPLKEDVQKSNFGKLFGTIFHGIQVAQTSA